jgi:hypothetical protein
MASYLPPLENLAIFDPSVFRHNENALTIDEGLKYFLAYPAAQGAEALQAIDVNGVATFNSDVLFASLNPPTSAQTLPPTNDSSTKIPTTEWVQLAVGAGSSSLLSTSNAWTNDNNFQGTNFLYTGALQVATNNGNYVATNQFVQSAIQAAQQQSGTYAGLQETLIYSEIPYNYSSLGGISANPLYSYGVSSISFAVSKSFNATAYSATDSVFVCFDPSNPISVIGQNTQLFFTPAPQSSFEPCVLAFSADGQYAIATSDSYATNPSELYLMSKSIGNPGSFIAVSGFYKFINDACLSADGQYQLLAEVSGSDTMYLSADYGINFNACANNGVWFSCAMSATGKYQMGISQYQYIANSSDYGANWTYTNFPSNSFFKCCMSANGQHQFVICNGGGVADSAFVSNNYGATWIQIDTAIGSTKLWVNCCITDCGRVMIGYENGGSGGAYFSLDYGDTWTFASTAVFLNGASKPTFSINGKYLIGQKSGFDPQYILFSNIF